MSTHTYDWASMHFNRWKIALSCMVGMDYAKVLELGCFEGMSTVWFLENIFTAGNTRYVAVDTFKGGSEHTSAKINFSEVKERFLENIKPFKFKVSVLEKPTQEAGRMLESSDFDFVYVDASHECSDVLADCVIAYRVLKPGGMCICDDYEWPGMPGDGPKEGIDAFLNAFKTKVTVTHKDYQVDWVKK